MAAKMDAAREQFLLDEIAKRDAIIERQAAEIVVLRQAVDALTRRIFGASREKLDPAQLELLLDPDAGKKAPAAAPADLGLAAEIKNHKKRPQKTRGPRIPDHLPVQREEVVQGAAISESPSRSGDLRIAPRRAGPSSFAARPPYHSRG
jgi:hypothetical protein